jgi:hypothetical protein
MTPEELERQTARQLDNLRQELEEIVTADTVVRVGREHYAELCRQATITDFIPLLVYRFTKDELTVGARDELHHAA